VDPASHGKGTFLFVIVFKFLGLCDAKGSIIKRYLRNHLGQTDKTFQSLEDIADVLNEIPHCVTMITPHLDETFGTFLSDQFIFSSF
jgi:hypothetical protein